jgi:photosystem II CP47 chlorophyll apoprotein
MLMLMILIAILVIWGGPSKKYLVPIVSNSLIFVIPFMTYLGITQFMGSWSIIGGTIMNPGIWSYKGLVSAHYAFSGSNPKL